MSLPPDVAMWLREYLRIETCLMSFNCVSTRFVGFSFLFCVFCLLVSLLVFLTDLVRLG